MRRIYNFLIFISAAVLLNTGFVYVGWQFFDVYQSLLDSKLRANLLSLRLTEAYFFREAAANKEITLIFVGDVMLSRGIAKQIQKYNDPRYPFLKIASITRAADLTFGNLEGPISNRGKIKRAFALFASTYQLNCGRVKFFRTSQLKFNLII